MVTDNTVLPDTEVRNVVVSYDLSLFTCQLVNKFCWFFPRTPLHFPLLLLLHFPYHLLTRLLQYLPERLDYLQSHIYAVMFHKSTTYFFLLGNLSLPYLLSPSHIFLVNSNSLFKNQLRHSLSHLIIPLQGYLV